MNPAFVRANEVQKLVGSRAALEAAVGPVRWPSLQEALQWMLADGPRAPKADLPAQDA